MSDPLPEGAELLAAHVIERSGDVALAEQILNPGMKSQRDAQQKQRRRISIALAILVWLVTFEVIRRSGIPSTPVVSSFQYSSNAAAQLFSVSTLGLLVVLFSNKKISSAHGMFPFLTGWKRLDQPSPVSVLRFVGWLMLVAVFGIGLFATVS